MFRIFHDDSQMPYSGRYAKRRLCPEDFVKLGPGKTLSTKVDLRRAYGFPSGRRVYKAMYSALHQHPAQTGFWELKSNEVTFSAW